MVKMCFVTNYPLGHFKNGVSIENKHTYHPLPPYLIKSNELQYLHPCLTQVGSWIWWDYRQTGWHGSQFISMKMVNLLVISIIFY